MERFVLNPPEGRIIATDGSIRIDFARGRCQQLVLDQHFINLLARYEGLVAKFFQHVEQGLAYEMMFGEKPSPEVLDGVKLLSRPLLTICAARRGEKYWFGYVSKPTDVTWRHRQRALVSLQFIDSLIGLASRMKTDQDDSEETFWLIRGMIDDGNMHFSFNSYTALVEFGRERWLGIEREDADIWCGLAEMSDFIVSEGLNSKVEGFKPDSSKSDYTADILSTDELDVQVTLFWNGFPQFEKTFNVNLLLEISFLIQELWPKSLTAAELEAMLYDEDDDEGEVGAS